VALASRRDKGKVVISEIEHLSIINIVPLLKRMGFEVVKIPVDGEGFIDLDALSDAVDKDTILVSINMANHEIGTIEPLKEAVEIVRDRNPDAYIHSDASDAYGRIPIDVSSLGIDLMTLSSYKILGPRGVGALYVREGVRIERIIEGQVGTQRLWPGIENTPLIVGFRKASDLMFKDFEKLRGYLGSLRDRLIKGILDSVDDTILNGPQGDKRAPDNINISFLRSEGEALTIELSLYGVYASSGSACTRRMLTPSHVMTAIGREYEAAHGSILMKVTRLHTMDDIDYVLEVLPKAVERIRSITPSGGD
jgi:cysteine desulfurase